MAVRTPRPSADVTRERILAAALDRFSELSFEGATTREIAARAGVTQGLLNYHFSSKDELWRAAVDGLFAELSDALDSRAEGLRGVDALTRTQATIAAAIIVRDVRQGDEQLSATAEQLAGVGCALLGVAENFCDFSQAARASTNDAASAPHAWNIVSHAPAASVPRPKARLNSRSSGVPATTPPRSTSMLLAAFASWTPALRNCLHAFAAAA